MQISAIVPHHSNKRVLRHCLATLDSTLPKEVEIIVVLNNGDPDELAIDLDPTRYRAIREPTALGYGPAVNRGALEARGEYLLFCDNDTFYLGDWLSPMVDLLAPNRNIGSVSARLLHPGTGRIVDYGIGFTRYNAPHPFMDRLPSYPLCQRTRQVQAACSACMLMRKEMFFEIGLFDDDRHSYYNDISLCLRLGAAGLTCWVSADSTAFHKSSFPGSARASYKDSSLKGDQKAAFVAKYGHLLAPDMAKYFAESRDHLSQAHPLASSYILLDLTNITDGPWHREMLGALFPLADIYELPTGVRDSQTTSLLEHLGTNLLNLRLPLAYFVDRYVSVMNNEAWFSLRPRTDDVVIDRNGNMLYASDLSLS